MPIFDADAFADWLSSAYDRSHYKSHSALAIKAGLSRSTVSALAGAKKQPLTNKPSQPEPETAIALAVALGEDVDKVLLLAGHAPNNQQLLPVEFADFNFSKFNKEELNDIAEFIEFKLFIKINKFKEKDGVESKKTKRRSAKNRRYRQTEIQEDKLEKDKKGAKRK